MPLETLQKILKNIKMEKRERSQLIKSIKKLKKRMNKARNAMFDEFEIMQAISYCNKAMMIRSGIHLVKSTQGIMLAKGADIGKLVHPSPYTQIVLKGTATLTHVICGVLVPFAGSLLSFMVEGIILSEKLSNKQINEYQYSSLMKKSALSNSVSSGVCVGAFLIGAAVVSGPIGAIAGTIVGCVVGTAIGFVAAKKCWSKSYQGTRVKAHYEAFDYFGYDINTLLDENCFTNETLGEKFREKAIFYRERFEDGKTNIEQLYLTWNVLVDHQSILKVILDFSKKTQRKLIKDVQDFYKKKK